ncbi:MAG: DUF2953 domain-containing protein [Ruminococcaceae bacterium]|nr:DUF2953 domain-containing protein [Oscillospiraceae bacterium]
MLLFYAILGGIVVLLLLLLFVPTTVGAEYVLEHKVETIKIRLRVLGIPFTFRISPKEDEKSVEKLLKVYESEDKESMTLKKFISFSKTLYQAFLEVKDECKELLHDIKERFTCEEVYFVIRYGTRNPATTGILNGAIWSAGSLVLAALNMTLGIKKKTLQVYPDFTRAYLNIHFKGTLQFKAFDAVRTVLKIMKLVNLIKAKFDEAETEE